MTRPIEVRTARFEQGVVAVLLLAAFVFRVELLVPISLGLLLVSALAGPRFSPLAVVFDTLVAPRLRGARRTETGRSRRLGTLLQTAGLALAFLLFLADVEGLAWLLTLVVAGTAALDCTTGLSAPTLAYRRVFRRRSSSGR